MSYLDYCINSSLTVREAMKIIDKISPQIVFIVEEKNIIASLTDGDIRRFLLNGGLLTELAVKAGKKAPLCAKTKSEAISLYDQRDYVAIPILNANGELTDIYIGGRKYYDRFDELNIPVVINAGGRGTRLEPYTKILPKPLIPVGEMPIIEHIMQNFTGYGCEKFSVIVNYKKELIKAYFADCEKNYDIIWYDEIRPLGTGGGLCYLKNKINSTFFFTNCDSLLISNYRNILRFHQENENIITMICAYKNLTIPYGVIEMGVNGSVESFREKPELTFLTNTGIYIVEPEVLDNIQDNEPIGFPEIIENEQKKGKKVAIYPVSENEWLDMGQVPELEKMRKRLYGN